MCERGESSGSDRKIYELRILQYSALLWFVWNDKNENKNIEREVLEKMKSRSPDSSENPFYFFFKNKKIETDSRISFK